MKDAMESRFFWKGVWTDFYQNLTRTPSRSMRLG